MPSLTFIPDKNASRLVLRTRASGLLARLAHDLEIEATELSLKASQDGDAWAAELSVPVAKLRVAGVLKKGDRLDTGVLSASDHADIENRIRTEVLAGGPEVRVQASGKSPLNGQAEVSLGPKSARFPVLQSVEPREGGGFDISGRCDVSLSALGVQEVKGPLGAFRVNDVIEVVYTFALIAQPE